MKASFKAKPIFHEESENFFLKSEHYRGGFYYGNLIVDGAKSYLVNGVVECNEEYITIEEWVPVHPESVELDKISWDKGGI